MIKGIGTDIVEIDRFRTLADKNSFLEQVLTIEEIDHAPKDLSCDTYFATMFAVKESVLKAMGCGLETGFLWKDIHVDAEWNIHLSGTLGHRAETEAISEIVCSHSHSDIKALAFVALLTSATTPAT
jgi:holo-[acyl-carrier protein] synthase